MSVTPYVLSIGRLSNVPPLSVLNSLKVSAVLIEASDYFDSITHRPSKNPVSSNLMAQYKQLKEYKMPTGVYMISRGRTLLEVTAELKCLFNAIKGMTLDVGIWIELHLSSGIKSVNDLLINACRDALISQGHKNQIGLKFTQDQISKFNYTDHVADWVMWLNKEASNTFELYSVIRDDIVPDDFFEVK